MGKTKTPAETGISTGANRNGSSQSNLSVSNQETAVKWPDGLNTKQRLDVEGIPAELKALPRWMNWRLEVSKKGDLTKVPKQTSGRNADVTKPATWVGWGPILKRHVEDTHLGVGFVLGEGIVVIDLDTCIDEDGDLTPEAAGIVREFNSYTEVSPSGTGVHIFIHGAIPRDSTGGPRNRRGNVEVYDERRYIAVTGLRVPGTPATIEPRQVELKALHADLFDQQQTTTTTRQALPSLTLSDVELLEKARNAKNGVKFGLLFDRGDWTDYPSASEADFALCSMLAFWTGKDAVRIDSLFRQSALFAADNRAEKWGDRRGSSTYGADTIERAIARTTEVYEPRPPTAGKVVSPEVVASTPDSPSTRKRPVIGSARDLQALVLPETNWAVKDFIPEGVTIFAGGQKLGKSWMVLGIGVAVATGGVALGKIPVERGDVLYLALEDTQKRIQKRLRGLLCGDEWPANLYYATEWPTLGVGCEEEIAAWLADHPDARLVIVDTFKKIRPPRRAGASVYDEDYTEVSALKKIADSFGVSIVVITHERKAEAIDPFDKVTGSMGVTGAADATIALKRERGKLNASLWITGRDIEEEREVAIAWNPVTTLWTLEGDAAEFRVSKERKDIIALLDRVGTALKSAEVAKELGKNGSTTRTLLQKMAGAQEIVHVGDGYCSLAVARERGMENFIGDAFDNLPDEDGEPDE